MCCVFTHCHQTNTMYCLSYIFIYNISIIYIYIYISIYLFPLFFGDSCVPEGLSTEDGCREEAKMGRQTWAKHAKPHFLRFRSSSIRSSKKFLQLQWFQSRWHNPQVWWFTYMKPWTGPWVPVPSTSEIILKEFAACTCWSFWQGINRQVCFILLSRSLNKLYFGPFFSAVSNCILSPMSL